MYLMELICCIFTNRNFKDKGKNHGLYLGSIFIYLYADFYCDLFGRKSVWENPNKQSCSFIIKPFILCMVWLEYIGLVSGHECNGLSFRANDLSFQDQRRKTNAV